MRYSSQAQNDLLFAAHTTRVGPAQSSEEDPKTVSKAGGRCGVDVCQVPVPSEEAATGSDDRYVTVSFEVGPSSRGVGGSVDASLDECWLGTQAAGGLPQEVDEVEAAKGKWASPSWRATYARRSLSTGTPWSWPAPAWDTSLLPLAPYFTATEARCPPATPVTIAAREAPLAGFWTIV